MHVTFCFHFVSQHSFGFMKDMNDPFDGVYQIKRSSAASFLLQIKWLIASQPFGKDVKFDTRGYAPEFDGNLASEVGKTSVKIDPASMGLPARETQQVAPTVPATTGIPVPSGA